MNHRIHFAKVFSELNLQKKLHPHKSLVTLSIIIEIALYFEKFISSVLS